VAASRGDPEPEAIRTNKLETRIENAVNDVLEVVLKQVAVSLLIAPYTTCMYPPPYIVLRQLEVSWSLL
jgi:hypothetical protein